MWQRHHDEVAAYKDIALNPNIDMYRRSALCGFLRIFTARVDSRLVGYQVFFVNPHPHTMQSTQAVQDIVFLEKEQRNGWAGYRFLKWCVEELQKERIGAIFQHINARNDFGHVLERMGFELVDLVYGLRVKE